MKNKLLKSCLVAACLAGFANVGNAQSILYPQHFDLNEVILTGGPMRNAMKVNAELLLRYDADRLMAPFVREAHLNSGKYQDFLTKHPSFRNWGDYSWSLEGHVGGHYITALALAYSAMKNDAELAPLAQKCLDRMNYCLEIMKDCQDAYNGNTEGMEGFIGGQPYTEMWRGLYSGNLDAFRKFGGMVPFYCQHKVLAGLRDAYVYAGSELGKELFRKLSDWTINVVSKLDDQQMQGILGWEHGGVNETLADAYKIFGDKKYLDGAVKFSHRQMIDGMQGKPGAYNLTFLDRKHANTQVPKYIGFERIDQVDAVNSNHNHGDYNASVLNFWDDVATHRTVCIGGNSVGEHFLPADRCEGYMNNLEGPESCNTNNMLKLSENLFDDTHDVRYADFYEAAMWNHILSTQDPATGGYVYFTTLRPQGYRIYSQVNSGMWCCVGTGMENHSKYGHFIYTHDKDTLFVNLFTPSKLDNQRFGVEQQTNFPYEQATTIRITKGGKFTLAIRRPSWAASGYKVEAPAKSNVQDAGKAGYVKITRKWKAGDVVKVSLPMTLRVEDCPNYTDYVAFKVGPILLAAKTTAENESDAAKTGLPYEKLKSEYADDSRMGHSPGAVGTKKSLSVAPMLIGDRGKLLSRINPKDVSKLQYTIQPSEVGRSHWPTLTLQPFYEIQHARYSCYWYAQSPEKYAQSPMVKADSIAAALEARTIDFVATGEQQSEAGHVIHATDPGRKGNWNSEAYREIPQDQEVSYTLTNLRSNNTQPLPTKDVALMLRFTNNDRNRRCSIYIDGKPLVENWVTPATHPKMESSGFFNMEFPIPESMLLNDDGSPKQSIRFTIKANNGIIAPSMFYLRLVDVEK